MWSGAVVCPASKLRPLTPRACMEICRSGPFRLPALGGASSGSWFARSGLVTVCPYVASRASLTKSRLQRWLGSSGRAIGARVPVARLRPQRRRTAGSRSGAVPPPGSAAARAGRRRQARAPGARSWDRSGPARRRAAAKPALGHQAEHGFPARREPGQFFPSKSFKAATSSIDSAKSFFSRRFSSSSAFSFCASATSRPPYFAFYR